MKAMRTRAQGVTRRAVLAASAAAPALAQTPAAQQPGLLADAKVQVQRNGDQLRNFKIPALLEPSFVFRP